MSCSRLNPRAWMSFTALRATSRSAADVQVLGESRDRADGDGEPSDERPLDFERVQVSDRPAER
jgi:hypothetical protein